MIQDLEIDPDLEAMRPSASALPAADVDPDLEAMRQAETSLSLYDVGFRLLPDRDIDEGLAELQVRRGFMRAIQPQAEDIPFAGFGFEVENAVRVQQGLARMQTGKATLDDEREVWRFMTSQAQKTTSGGTIAELLKSVATSGAEIATGAGVAAVGGKIAAKAAARAGLGALFSKAAAEAAETAFQRRVGELAVDTGIDLSTRAMLAEAAKAAGKGAAVLATTGVLQEAAPRAAGMTGGAWTAQSVTRALGSKMADEEAQAVADEWNAAAAFLLERGGGLIDGAIRQSIQLAAEGTGAAIGALPPFAQVNLLFGALFKKIAGEGAEAVGGKVAKAMMFSQPGGEVGEEFLAAVAEAAVMGDKPIVEAAMEVAEITPEMLVAFGLPGTAGAAMRRAKGGKITPSTPKALTGAGATEGGDPTQATPAAPVEGVAASKQPTVAPEVRDGLAGLQRALRERVGAEVEVQAVEPEGVQEQAAAAFARRRGVEVQFYERGALPEGTDEAQLEDAYFPGAGNRIFLRRGSRDVGAVAVHEQVHVWESQQPEARRAELTAALSELVPAEVRAVSQALARTPLYRGRPQAEIESEVRAGVAQTMAGLVQMLDTAQGRQAFTDLTARPEGALRRIATAVYDWIADRIRALPQSKRARARAFLRLARGEENRALAAQRLLDALNEIRPAEQRVDAGEQAVAPSAVMAEEAAPVAAQGVEPGPVGPTVTTEEARRRYGMPGATGFMSAIRGRQPDPRNAQFDTDVARARYGMPGQLAPLGFKRPGDPAVAATPEAAPRVVPPKERKDTPEQRRANRAARKARAAARVQGAAAQAQAEVAAREAAREAMLRERERVKQAVEKAARRKTTRVVEDTDEDIDWDAETTADIEQFGLGRDTERFAASLPPTIEVGGKQRPTVNSDGRPIAADEKGLRAFWRWFGDSKVVDGEGRPLVVYHGTAADFTRFERVGETDYGFFGPGFYFLTGPSAASEYAEYGGVGGPRDGANVKAAYLRAINPRRAMQHPELGSESAARAYRAETQELGHDAVWWSDEIVVFEPTQIKSATGNLGTFAPTNPDIRFAASLYNSVPALAQNTTRRYLDRFRTLFQDNTIPLRELPEVRTNVKRYRAQMPDRLRRFEDRLVAMLKPFQVGEFDDMERAVYLQAAMQRNAWLLQSRGVQDGAGISTADAQIELAQIEQRIGKPRLDALFAEHRSLNAERLAHLEEAGFITAQQVADWGTREPNWISMRDIDPDADEHIAFGVGGRSMSVRNPQIREAKGRKTELDHPLLAWASEYATRIVAAEKNKALRDAAANGIPSVPKPQNVPGGFTAPDTYVPYVEQGQQMFLETQSKEQADVLKALDGETLGLITSMFGKVTRAWSRAVTGQNPAFWPLNFLRDSFQAASYTLTERSAAYAAKAMARSYAVLPLLLRYQLTGNAAGLPMLDAAQRAGFKTTWVGRRTLSEQLAWMRDQVEGRRGPRAKLRAVLRTLESVGDSFEMATRYAVFEAEVQRQTKAGANQAEAEQLAGDYAREITLNFDTKGSLTPHLAAFFAFFNPAVQGGARLMQVAMSARGAGFVTSLALAGFLMEALNYAVADDDERTGLNLYGSLPEYEKSRNIILPLWSGKSPLKITMPYGLDSIYGLGRRLYLLVAGKDLDPRIETKQVVWEGLLHASTAFNPLGDISDPYTMVAPTVLRPFVEIDRNRKFGDRPIMRPGESFGQTVPDSARAFENIDDRVSGWLAVRIADVLNLGGPEELPTGLDVSPESVQHIIEFVAAGFGGRDLDRLSEHVLSDKPVSMATTIPVLRGFSTAVTDHYIANEYYDIAEKASRIGAMERNPANKDRLEDVRNYDRRAWELRRSIGRADRKMGDLRRALRVEGLTPENVAEIRERMTEVQAGIVRQYYAPKE